MGFDRVKAFASTPILTYAGLLIIALFISFQTVDRKIQAKKAAELLAAPQLADVYEIKDSEGNFSLLTIEAIAEDSVNIVIRNLMSTKRAGLSKIKSKGRMA